MIDSFVDAGSRVTGCAPSAPWCPSCWDREYRRPVLPSRSCLQNPAPRKSAAVLMTSKRIGGNQLFQPSIAAIPDSQTGEYLRYGFMVSAKSRNLSSAHDCGDLLRPTKNQCSSFSRFSQIRWSNNLRGKVPEGIS